MTKLMLIDASHREETRVAVADDQHLVEFDIEIAGRQQVAGNIYLAKVTRVEPSLQAAFVEYGGQRHGFLAFNEIHPDYYQIPVADREALKAEQAAQASREDEPEVKETSDDVEDLGGEDVVAPRPQQKSRHYKIQEVIKRRQIILVQVVKEERGNKGAALTTYLSLAGRYCVLMPNTASGGGISRKITNAADRKRLKTIAQDLEVPEGMGLIIRTAGAQRTKAEIKRDFEYLLRVWSKVREDTLNAVAPSLVFEEASLVKKSIRDLFSRDVEAVHVQGEAAYREAKDFMKMLTPSYAPKVKQYKEPTPLFAKHGLERQLSDLTKAEVRLASGGYLVMNSTEALVAVDVNSGKSTREHSIENTAIKTNLEAADEVARQLRLRDLGGLVVIDFIDMDDARHNRQVEKRLKDALKNDRARIQVGKISNFGLLEMSRQRLRPSMVEVAFSQCPHCLGHGIVRNIESLALEVVRLLESQLATASAHHVILKLRPELANYLANEKRELIFGLEDRYAISLRIDIDPHLEGSGYEIQLFDGDGKQINPPAPTPAPAQRQATRSDQEDEGNDKRRKRRRRRKDEGERGDADIDAANPHDDDEASTENESSETSQASADDEGDEDKPRRRRRGRRGGRRRKKDGSVIMETPETLAAFEAEEASGENANATEEAQKDDATEASSSAPKARQSSAKPKPNEAEPDETTKDATPSDQQEASLATPPAEQDVKPARRGWWKSRFGI